RVCVRRCHRRARQTYACVFGDAAANRSARDVALTKCCDGDGAAEQRHQETSDIVMHESPPRSVNCSMFRCRQLAQIANRKHVFYVLKLRQKLFKNASLLGNFCSRSSSIFIAVIGSVPARARRSVWIFGNTVGGRSFSSFLVPVCAMFIAGKMRRSN